MADSRIDFARYAEAIYVAVWGPPNRGGSKTNLRWGNSGSKSVDLKKGTWFDNEAGKGGGVHDLLVAEYGDGWREWLLDKRILDVTDERSLRQGMRRNSGGGDRDGGFYGDQSHNLGERDDAPWGEGYGGGDYAAPGGDAILGADGKPLTGKRRMTDTYDYTDEDGNDLYQVCRFEWLKDGQRRKTFTQRQRSGSGGWINNVQGLEHTLYRRPELSAVRPGQDDLLLAEGEKDVDRLIEMGFNATTNSGGAAHFGEQHIRLLEGHNVVILVDNDAAGEARALKIAPLLQKRAKSVRVFRIAEYWADAPEKADVIDWVDQAGGRPNVLEKWIDQLKEWSPPIPQSKFGAVTFSRIFDKVKPYPWLVKGVIPAGERIIIFGEPQSGKSFATLDMAMHIAAGREYCGRKVRQVGVAYCAFEGGKGFVGRAQAAAQELGLAQTSDVPMTIYTRPVDLFSQPRIVPELIVEMQAHALLWPAHKLGLIVIDTVSAATPGMNENDGKEIGQFLHHARLLKDAFGEECSIALVHHKPKMGDGPRGSTKLTGDLETSIEIRPDPDNAVDADRRIIREAFVAKQREGPSRFVYTRFVLPEYKLGLDDDGEEFSTCTVRHFSGKKMQINSASAAAIKADPKAGMYSLSPNEFTLFKALVSAIKQHGEPVPAEINPDRPIGVTTARWAAVFRQMDIVLEPDEEDAPSEDQPKKRSKGAEHKEFQRLAKKLRDFCGVIGSKTLEGGGPRSTWAWRTHKLVAGIDRPRSADPAETTETASDLMRAEDYDDVL